MRRINNSRESVLMEETVCWNVNYAGDKRWQSTGLFYYDVTLLLKQLAGIKGKIASDEILIHVKLNNNLSLVLHIRLYV